jgi:hypothetical protein
VNLHTEIIDLASEGFFYPSGSVLSKGTVGLLPITAEHEEFLCSVNLANRGVLGREFLSKIVDGKVDYDTLFYCDWQSILLNLRVMNYGAQTKMKIVCDSCSHEFEEDVSFAFKGRPFDFSRYERGVNRLSYVFPKCKRTVNFRLPTCAEHEIHERGSWLAMAKIITTGIDGVENIEDFYENELPAADGASFRKYVENKTPGYVTDIAITCPSCQNIKTSKFDVGMDIFGIRPESKMNIHSEIFDLCYYSNGAFTQESVYHMPTSLRTFYIKKLLEVKKAEAEAMKKAEDGPSKGKTAKPPVVKK